MKWSLQQLQKQTFPCHFDETFDFSSQVKDIADAIAIDDVRATGDIIQVDSQTYQLSYRLQALLTLECSLTLEPVPYQLDEQVVELLSTVERDDAILIQNTIDLTESVFSNVIIYKPIRVVRDDAYAILKERNITLGDIPDDEE